MATANSTAALEALSSGSIDLYAKYAFLNPESPNGPFGNFSLLLLNNKLASGKMQINTLFGLGSVSNLTYQGEYTTHAGYTTVIATGQGMITIRPNPPRPIVVKIEIKLQPGFHTGTVTASGYFEGFPCKATSIHVGDNKG